MTGTQLMHWNSLRRYYWLKVKALGELGDWAELETFAKEKKPPIGYKPFADVCIEHGNLNEAIKYIKKISEADVRARLYIQTKCVEALPIPMMVGSVVRFILITDFVIVLGTDNGRMRSCRLRRRRAQTCWS
jgi:hypothetical protein